METSDEWIRQRTGIVQRHFAGEGIGASDLAAEASRRAIERAHIRAEDIDYIIFCTMTPDFLFPGSGALLGTKLGIDGVPALDLRQQCCAVPFALQVADGLIHTGAAKTVLLAAGEAHAGFMPWTNWELLYGAEGEPSEEDFGRATRHRAMAVLFGDGAGALIIQASPAPQRGLLGVEVHTDGSRANHLYIEGGGFRRRPYWTPAMLADELQIPKMAGPELFKAAVTKLPEVVRSLCRRHGVEVAKIDWLIAHQANERINRAVVDALGLPDDRAPCNIARYGNTSGATIPILLDELLRDERIQPGDLICFLAVGSGLHWGAALLRL
jgi:3-oxoacyl-[acyl-carrier-protein] synthase-3